MYPIGRMREWGLYYEERNRRIDSVDTSAVDMDVWAMHIAMLNCISSGKHIRIDPPVRIDIPLHRFYSYMSLLAIT